MKKMIIYLYLFLLFISCSSVPQRDNFETDDLQIKIEIIEEKSEIGIKLICENISHKLIHIPLFYLTFNNSSRKNLRNNWFLITDKTNTCVKYYGDYFEPPVKMKKNDFQTLKPNESVEIFVEHISFNYDLEPSSEYFISYLGPLGESNKVVLIY